MKKTSILTLLMLAFCVFANAQSRLTVDIPQLYDGMDSITVHYNPFGSGGDGTDTVFQTYTGALFMYIYTTDSTTGSGGHNQYADGSWTSIETIPAATLTRMSATDWVTTLPNMRSFLNYFSGASGAGVPSGTYVEGLNFIVHDSGSSIVQSANMYASVSESYALEGLNGYPLSTGPATTVPGTLVADTVENFAIYYHPMQDTFSSDAALVAAAQDSTMWVWAWAYASDGHQYDITPGASWTSVSTTPNDAMVKIDSNNFAWDIRSLRADFISTGMPSDVSIDSIGFIARTAGDGGATVSQTTNFYVPMRIFAPDTTADTTVTHIGVKNVNATSSSVNIYPNPATEAIFVSYSFAQPGDAKLIINNMLGQTVMNKELGRYLVGNIYLSVNNLPSGVYIATVTNGTSTTVQRFVKE